MPIGQDLETSKTAQNLKSWFDSVYQLLNEALYTMHPDPRRQDAITTNVLTKHGRTLYESEVDLTGELYTSICMALTAICKKLNFIPKAEHWKSALDNVLKLRQQLAEELSQASIYLGSPSSVFKAQLEESLGNAGFLPRVTILNEENRKVALGLATNWLLRFLLAYALEAEKVEPQERAQNLFTLREWLLDTEKAYLGAGI